MRELERPDPRHRPAHPGGLRGDLRRGRAELRGGRRQLFPGGRGRLRLVREDAGPRPVLGGAESDGAGEERIDDGGRGRGGRARGRVGVEIELTPAGKATKRLSLLSGGEKSMTALAFLFAVFLARPCPFYILDEVEAALDDLNIDRFLRLLRRFSDRAQFIVVTHQKRTMEAADCLYGVSMAGNGVSKVVSRRLPPPRRRGAAACRPARCPYLRPWTPPSWLRPAPAARGRVRDHRALPRRHRPRGARPARPRAVRVLDARLRLALARRRADRGRPQPADRGAGRLGRAAGGPPASGLNGAKHIDETGEFMRRGLRTRPPASRSTTCAA